MAREKGTRLINQAFNKFGDLNQKGGKLGNLRKRGLLFFEEPKGSNLPNLATRSSQFLGANPGFLTHFYWGTPIYFGFPVGLTFFYFNYQGKVFTGHKQRWVYGFSPALRFGLLGRNRLHVIQLATVILFDKSMPEK